MSKGRIHRGGTEFVEFGNVWTKTFLPRVSKVKFQKSFHRVQALCGLISEPAPQQCPKARNLKSLLQNQVGFLAKPQHCLGGMEISSWQTWIELDFYPQ